MLEIQNYAVQFKTYLETITDLGTYGQNNKQPPTQKIQSHKRILAICLFIRTDSWKFAMTFRDLGIR